MSKQFGRVAVSFNEAQETATCNVDHSHANATSALIEIPKPVQRPFGWTELVHAGTQFHHGHSVQAWLEHSRAYDLFQQSAFEELSDPGRAFGRGLPNALIATFAYNPTVDVFAAGAVGRGVVRDTAGSRVKVSL
jgi:hypothetical protein